MTCRTDQCRQGRKACPTPGLCCDSAEPVSYQTVFADLERIAKRTALWCLAFFALFMVLALSSDALLSHWPRLVAWVSF